MLENVGPLANKEKLDLVARSANVDLLDPKASPVQLVQLVAWV